MSKRHKSCQDDPDFHAQLGYRLRTTRCSLGWSIPDAAKYFQVNARTWHNWEIGAHRIPFAVYKLCRVLSGFELPHADWSGWFFQGGVLVTPEGRIIEPRDSSWWSLMVRNARSFHSVYAENTRLRQELKAARVAQSGHMTQAQRGMGPVASDAPTGEAGRAAEPAGSNLLIGHFGTHKLKSAGKQSFFASVPIANYAFKLVNTNNWR